MGNAVVRNSVVASLIQAKWKIEQAVERLEFALDELEAEDGAGFQLLKYRIEEAKVPLVAYIDLEGRGPGLIDSLIQTVDTDLEIPVAPAATYSGSQREGI